MALLKVTERVQFDPSNPEHRAAIRKFMVRRSWNDAGVKFVLLPEYDNLIDQTQTQLINWYFEQDSAIA